jgi:alpha-beta hydrolase superfamily lysophospholipase
MKAKYADAPAARTSAERLSLKGTDGFPVAYLRWSPDRRPRGVVQIAHGLGEHAGRYSELAERLVDLGFAVYGNDHRGHGLTARSAADFGDFGPGGFDQLVEDMVSLRVIAKHDHPHAPYILLGHSMGSFAAQQFVLEHSHSIDGLALSGSGTLDALAQVARSQPATAAMTLMNAAFEPARTPFDWLSRDAAEVDAFIADPLCFPSLRPKSLKSLLGASRRLSDPSEIRHVQQTLPVYIFSGTDDPVGQRLAGVRALMERYRNAGLTSIDHHFYPGGRHEMLHETNRRDVIARLLSWMTRVVERAA